MTRHRDIIVLTTAILAAVAIPALVLRAPAPRPATSMPKKVAYVPPATGSLTEPLFPTSPDSLTQMTVEDPTIGAPAMVGIVGRLPDDAVAMVRTPEGRTRTLAVGESIDGWRLTALAPEAALFVRGDERIRVPLPAAVESETPPEVPDQ